MKQDETCVFCRNDFTASYQLVSSDPKYWLFIHNKNPHTDYHCLVILKREAMESANTDHIGDIAGLDDSERSSEILSELGRVLNRAARAIKACSPDIERVLMASLSTGHGSKHLHFHLIPKRCDETVKTVNNLELDGGGMFFLARKEIAADTFREFIKSRSGCMTDKLLSDIDKAVAERVAMNTELLREKFQW